MLPMPTRPASDIMSDWHEDVPSSDFSPFLSWSIMSGMCRTWRKPVRNEKYRPASRQSAIRGIDQISSFVAVMRSAKLMGAPGWGAGAVLRGGDGDGQRRNPNG